MRVWIIWILIPSVRPGGGGGEGVGCRVAAAAMVASVFFRAMVSSRRTAIHSVDLRLLCWKRSIRGVERRSEVYWR